MSEFDEKASTWDEQPDRVERVVKIANYLQATIDLTGVKSAMEYGSGTGLLSFALKNVLPDITLMDASVKMTDVALQKVKAQKVENLHPIHYDLMEQNLPDKRFDLIFTLLTLHHIDDTASFLDRIFAVLNKGGRVILIDLDKEDGTFHAGEFHGHKGFEQLKLQDQLEQAGLKAEHYSICYSIEKEIWKALRGVDANWNS